MAAIVTDGSAASAESSDACVGAPVTLRSFLKDWAEFLTPRDCTTKGPGVAVSSTRVEDADGSNGGSNGDVGGEGSSAGRDDFLSFAQDEMGLSRELVVELDAGCRPETVNPPGGSLSLLYEIQSTGTNLLTLQFQKQELDRRKKDGTYRHKILDKMKYRTRDGPWKHDEYRQQSESVEDSSASRAIASQPDVLLTVQVYRSYVKRKNLILEQEFEVLGQQSLTELRDQIYCIADHVAIGDFSQSPDIPCTLTSKDLYKSGFFFIEGVFYNDMRDPDARDYSSGIREWAREPSRGVGPFDARPMQETRFVDLTVRPGQPYCYLHQGNCEHLIIFSDVRMMHPEDCQYLDKYPIMTYRSRERKPKCRVCQANLAKWVTSESPLSPEDPCFFCDTCFRALHCTSDGKMLFGHPMMVYPYPSVRL